MARNRDEETSNEEGTSVPETPAEETVAATEAPAAKTKKDPLPEGFVTPVQFAKELDKHLGNAEGSTRPQYIYSYMKNSKTFPSSKNTDGHFMVPVAEGLAWVDAKEGRKSEREAAKAAKAAEAAATPAEATA